MRVFHAALAAIAIVLGAVAHAGCSSTPSPPDCPKGSTCLFATTCDDRGGQKGDHCGQDSFCCSMPN